jgi:FixJ family two-component response regulator
MAKRKRQSFVAVVDDDSGMRTATLDLLAANGLATRGFASAERFLKSRVCSKAACLVLDLRLPGMSGLELQRELNGRGLTIPVIFATAEQDADGRLQTQLREAGATAVLLKPFDPEQLLQLVRAALEACQES